MKEKKRNNLWILAGTCLVLVVAVVLLLGRRNSSSREDSSVFAVEDTAHVHWIFLADKQENRVLLTRQEDGSWRMNHQEVVVQENVDNLLSVIHNITVKSPIGNAARENVNKWLAIGATKVQIAYEDYRIKIGKLKCWQYEKVKTFYIGTATQDNLGNYAVMEGSNMPVVVYQPGFRGFISPYFSSLEEDWKSHQITHLRISQIKQVTVTDFEHPEGSLRINRHGDKHFDIISLADGAMLPVYDTLKLYDHLGAYRNLNFEFFVDSLGQAATDSILSLKFKEISVVDTAGTVTTITLYHLLNEYNTEEFEYNPEFMEAYNRDKFYITLGSDKSHFYICQFFVFDRIIQPIGYYLPDSESFAIK